MVDAEPPDTTITAGPTGTVRSTGATFTFTASEPGASFECRLDEGAWAPCGSPRTLSGLSYGRHSFHVRALDQLGNTDVSQASRAWTVERTPQKPIPPPVDEPRSARHTRRAVQKLIAAQLGRDLATTARTLRRLGARRLRARRGLPRTHSGRSRAERFSAKLTMQGPGGPVVLGKGTRSAGKPGAHCTPAEAHTHRRAQAGRRRPRARQAGPRVP